MSFPLRFLAAFVAMTLLQGCDDDAVTPVPAHVQSSESVGPTGTPIELDHARTFRMSDHGDYILVELEASIVAVRVKLVAA